ncbi:lysoplasmalogenase family protein [Nocardioides sp. R-C-SC26]|uniref:lysoplasmalogenase family protein n=1 Tax=Nocardioides sp. R-C-SC26 TaxID=2870414 RepID=UPI001E302284|nr:lysoplasmalogenase family protein [Nocardioides sp. R-C-SC26]
MRSPSVRATYAATAVATALAGALERRRPLMVSKSLLMPVLQARPSPPLLRVALAAAWVGDVALLPPASPEDDAAARRRLRRGAAAFAVQQGAYLVAMRRAGITPATRVAVPVAVWMGALASLDARARRSAVDPMIAGYGALLAAMAATAMSSQDPVVARGGASFLASDSTILMRELLLRSHASRALAEGLVLSSYAFAQWSLVDGLTRRS